MSRLPPVLRSDLPSDKQRIYDVIAQSRTTGLGGPFSVLIRHPLVALPANELHNAFRLKGKLDRRLFELSVVMVAKEWSASYALDVHEQQALKAGVSPSALKAIREAREPETLPDDERLIYHVVREILDHKSLTPATYEKAVDLLGVENLIELVAAIGFYSMLCGVLNVFEVSIDDV